MLFSTFIVSALYFYITITCLDELSKAAVDALLQRSLCLEHLIAALADTSLPLSCSWALEVASAMSLGSWTCSGRAVKSLGHSLDGLGNTVDSDFYRNSLWSSIQSTAAKNNFKTLPFVLDSWSRPK